MVLYHFFLFLFSFTHRVFIRSIFFYTIWEQDLRKRKRFYYCEQYNSQPDLFSVFHSLFLPFLLCVSSIDKVENFIQIDPFFY